MKRGISFWDILAWIILIGILVWVILKMLGIINTPILIEYAPYLGGIYLAGWAMYKLEMTFKDVGELKKFRYKTVDEINNLKLNCIKNHK